jgi:hypothetical protein
MLIAALDLLDHDEGRPPCLARSAGEGAEQRGQSSASSCRTAELSTRCATLRYWHGDSNDPVQVAGSTTPYLVSFGSPPYPSHCPCAAFAQTVIAQNEHIVVRRLHRSARLLTISLLHSASIVRPHVLRLRPFLSKGQSSPVDLQRA